MCEYWDIEHGQKHFKMAAFREEKLTRKKNGPTSEHSSKEQNGQL